MQTSLPIRVVWCETISKSIKQMDLMSRQTSDPFENTVTDPVTQTSSRESFRHKQLCY